MSIQCQTVVQSRDRSMGRTEAAGTAAIRQTRAWVQSIHTIASDLIDAWRFNRRIRRSRRMLEALPENILHDIGWPNIDDRLPGINRDHRA